MRGRGAGGAGRAARGLEARPAAEGGEPVLRLGDDRRRVRGDEAAVFVVGDDRIAKRRVVTIVRSQGDHVLVEGLEPGAAVIDLPPVDLADGARVER